MRDVRRRHGAVRGICLTTAGCPGPDPTSHAPHHPPPPRSARGARLLFLSIPVQDAIALGIGGTFAIVFLFSAC